MPPIASLVTQRPFTAVLSAALLVGAAVVAVAWSLHPVATKATLDLTTHPVGFASLGLFALAYVFVMSEELLHMRKSKTVLVAAGVIWAMVAAVYAQHGDHHTAEHAVRHNLLEYAELFLFLLAAMTFINTMEERRVFDAVRSWIVRRRLGLRAVFWVTGGVAFVLSPVADNLTTALIMGAVVMSVGGKDKQFVAMGCVNVVVAANAGGAFSPFGDITTLMVWQKGILGFTQFFQLLLPSLVNWAVPAALMSLFLGQARQSAVSADDDDAVEILPGGRVVIALFLCTIAAAVSAHSVLHLPPVLGMMTGLGVLKLYGWRLKQRFKTTGHAIASSNVFEAMTHEGAHEEEYDIFKRLEKAEWDTLMFFYGVILCVGGLGTIGYLEAIAHAAYGPDVGATAANIGVGVLSAIIDNIPVMFAVLAMSPEMGEGQWLLVTLTAGVGGSLLSIGSAAGVALMGTARGTYTFFAHLRWSWAIALGYAASIGVHFLVNADTF